MPFGSRPLLSRGEESFHFHAASLNIPFFNAHPRLNILWGFFKGDIQGIPDEPSLEKVSPPSSILHSLPPFSSLLRNSCFVSRNEGTKERKKERGREEVGGTVWKPFVAAAIIPVNATDDNYWIISCINILPFSRPSRASHKRRPPFIGAWIPPLLPLLPSIMHIRVRLRLYYYNRAHTGLH